MKIVSKASILFLVCITLACSNDPSVISSPEILPVNQLEIKEGTAQIAITNCRIIVGDGKTVIERGNIIIEGSKITAVGTIEATPIPSAVTKFDASGMTVLPGLIDAHFHLDQLKGLPTEFLKRGITSVRDPGAWIEAYEEERSSGRPLPRLYLTGPHFDMFPPAYPKNSIVLRDPSEAQSAVFRLRSQGASAIKIYFRSSLANIQATCEAADKKGIPVTAHLEMTDIYDAVAAGLAGIEHITSLGTNLVPPQIAEAYKQAILNDNNARRTGRYQIWQQIRLDSDAADRLAGYLAQQHTFVCPTLGAFEYQPEEQLDTMRWEGFQNMLRYTFQLHQAGVPVVVGSHAYVKYAEYGWAYHHEMELLEQLGMKPLKIIQAATSLNAQFFRIEDQLGTIETDKLADLVLVEGNPLEGITNLRKVKKVMLAGNWMALPE